MKHVVLLFLLSIVGAWSLESSASESTQETPQPSLQQKMPSAGYKYMFCRYCGRACPDFASRRAHEAGCPKNPHHTKDDMSNNIDLDQLSFIQQLKELPYIEQIILYGSRARGDASERADIDIAIECPMATGYQWQTIMDIVGKADTLLKIDCVRLDSLKIDNPLRVSILRDGKILFQRNEK